MAIQGSKISMFFIFILAVVGCEKEIPPIQSIQPKLVLSQTIEPTGHKTRYFNGVVAASKSVALAFRINGQLQQVNVTEGQRVKQGQELARLDNSDQVIQLKSQQAAFVKAEAEYQRARKLVKTGAISQADLDTLKAQFIGAEAGLASAKRDLENTRLNAPFSGVIAKRYIDNFEKVTTASPFVMLQNLQELEVKIDLPESLLAALKQNRENRQSTAVTAQFPNHKGVSYPLTFKEIATVVNDNQSYELTFTMASPEDITVLPGMTVKVSIALTQAAGRIVVPTHTVQEDEQGRYVFLVAQKMEKKIIEKRYVEVGGLAAQGVLINSGLNAGDILVTAGISQLYEGQVVRCKEGQ